MTQWHRYSVIRLAGQGRLGPNKSTHSIYHPWHQFSRRLRVGQQETPRWLATSTDDYVGILSNTSTSKGPVVYLKVLTSQIADLLIAEPAKVQVITIINSKPLVWCHLLQLTPTTSSWWLTSRVGPSSSNHTYNLILMVDLSCGAIFFKSHLQPHLDGWPLVWGHLLQLTPTTSSWWLTSRVGPSSSTHTYNLILMVDLSCGAIFFNSHLQPHLDGWPLVWGHLLQLTPTTSSWWLTSRMMPSSPTHTYNFISMVDLSCRGHLLQLTSPSKVALVNKHRERLAFFH